MENVHYCTPAFHKRKSENAFLLGKRKKVIKQPGGPHSHDYKPIAWRTTPI
uniref:Uncharacterized protein n=1 Tax=Arion vulgaris TaxID=1028688 RepID=A0A0B6Z6S8_9EUPU